MIALQREIIDRYGHLMIIGEKKSKTNRKPRCIWHNDNFYNKITILKKHANLNKK